MGCGCDVSKISVGICMNDVMQDQKVRETLSQYKMISKKGFNEGRVLPVLQYASCMDWEQFKSVFFNFGIDVEIGDLPTLAQIIESGGDKTGMLNARNGQQVFIDIMQEIRKMKFTAEQVQQAQCSILFLPNT